MRPHHGQKQQVTNGRDAENMLQVKQNWENREPLMVIVIDLCCDVYTILLTITFIALVYFSQDTFIRTTGLTQTLCHDMSCIAMRMMMLIVQRECYPEIHGRPTTSVAATKTKDWKDT